MTTTARKPRCRNRSTKPNAASAPPPPTGIIEGGRLYRLSAAKRELGWAEKSYRRAVRQGLEPIKFGRIRYLRGDDILEFFDRLADEQRELMEDD